MEDFFNRKVAIEIRGTYRVDIAFPFLQSYNDYLFQQKKEKGLIEEEPENDDDRIFADQGEIRDVILDEAGRKEAERTFNKKNPLFAVLQPPPTIITAASPIVGFAIEEDVRKADSFLNDSGKQGYFPKDLTFCWTHELTNGPVGVPTPSLIAIQKPSNGEKVLKTTHIQRVWPDVNEFYQRIVNLQLDPEGASLFAKLIIQSKEKSMAIIREGKVVLMFEEKDFYFSVDTGIIQIHKSKLLENHYVVGGFFDNEEIRDLAGMLKPTSQKEYLKIVDHAILDD